ncbi:MAG: 50S ribosomal protein L10 [Chloroflexi bacterium]|nr:50S ribosomal protein L10 [Chloroflexota bacterium]
MAKGVKTGPRVKRKGGGQPAKARHVDELVGGLGSSSAVIVTEYRGLKVKELQDLRARLRPRGVEYHVVKNSLFARAAEKSGRGAMRPMLTGPTAVAYGSIDEVELARTVVEETRTYRALKIVGGFVGGSVVQGDEVTALSQLPGRQQLRAEIVGSLQAPLGQLVATLQAPLGNLVRVLQARA